MSRYISGGTVPKSVRKGHGVNAVGASDRHVGFWGEAETFCSTRRNGLQIYVPWRES